VYLWSAYYDGRSGKPVLRFYSGKELTEFPVDMLSFFYTNAPEDEIKDEAVVCTQRVERLNLLYMRTVSLTKVCTKSPTDVPRLREALEAKGYITYESNVRIHRNAVIDLRLVPFVKTRIEFGKFKQSWSDPLEAIEAAIPVPSYVAFDIEVLPKSEFEFPDPKAAERPVILISASAKDSSVLFVNCEHVDCSQLPRKVSGFEVKEYESEAEMLADFFNFLKRYSLAVTFNGDGFDVPYLCNRAKAFSLRCPFKPLFSYQSPLSGEDVTAYDGDSFMHLDLFPFFANQSVKASTFSNAYSHPSLNEVASALLGEGKSTEEPVYSMWRSKKHYELAVYSATDAELTKRLFEYADYTPWKVLVILSRISKLPPFETARTTIQSWITNLLLWMHRERNAVMPSRKEIELHKEKVELKSASKTGKKYAGAVVFDLERRGTYWNVAVVDFASLYPTIIIKHNISYETVNPLFECEEKEVSPARHTICKSVKGIFSEMVQTLRDLRVHKYKKLAKDPKVAPEARKLYDAVQMSLKVFINASYGVSGSSSFQLYTPTAAETVTAYGRHYITEAKELAESLGLKVIYGDTDSLFLLVPKGKEGLVEELIRLVEERFGMEIELDKWFVWVGFHAKKNYVGLTKDGKLVVKGMMGIKRSVPPYIRKVFGEALEKLKDAKDEESLSRARQEIVRLYSKARREIASAKVPPEELALSAALSKDPSEYERASPAVEAAKKAEKWFKVKFKRGDVVRYVKGKSGYLPVVLGKSLPRHKVDYVYYVKRLDSVFEQLFGALEIAGSGLYRFLRVAR